MSPWLQHLPVVPIVAPLLAGALCLLLLDRRGARIVLALLSLMVQICAAATLLYLTTDAMPGIWTEGVGTYSIGDWPAPFGIVLVIDRLSAIMLLLTSLVGSAALVYSLAHWDRVAPGFHSLFQFLLMGINGALLTGDLFNFFVFFEVLLASSYGLLLHGSGSVRVKSGVHYIVVNLTASLLFLVGVSMIYGMTGTLSMAQLPQLVARLDPDDRAIFQSGAAILGVAFLVKAGIWPLNFWLPTAYAASSAPVAAVFSLMTKVGVYAVLRVGTLLASGDVRSSFIDIGLFYGGIATIAYAIIGMLSAQQLGRLIAYSVIGSSGMLFMTLGLGIEALTAPALYYLLSSVLATCAFFLLNGMTDRARMLSVSTPADVAPLPDVTYQGFGVRESPDPHSVEDEIGIAVPAAMAFLGLAFVCCVLLVAGLPPLSGFIGKLAILHVLVTTGGDGGMSWNVWALIIAVLAMGLAAVIALSRIGMRLFWTVTGRTTPRLRLIEAGPVAFLLALCIGLTVGGRPIMTYLDSAARSLHSPETYIRVVMSAQTRGDDGQAEEAAP